MTRTCWTPPEDTLLLYHYGSEAPGDTVDRMGRTRTALRDRLRRLGYAPALAGRFTTAEALAAASGYHRHTITRASRALGQRVARSDGEARGSFYLYTEDQAVEALAWLAREGSGVLLSKLGNPVGRWAWRHNRCRACTTQGTRVCDRHAAHGLCRGCTGRAKRRGLGPEAWVRLGRATMAVARVLAAAVHWAPTDDPPWPETDIMD